MLDPVNRMVVADELTPAPTNAKRPRIVALSSSMTRTIDYKVLTN
jgi:hypothetical protein